MSDVAACAAHMDSSASCSQGYCGFRERGSSLLVVAVFDEGGDVGRLRILLGSDGCELVPVPVLLQRCRSHAQ